MLTGVCLALMGEVPAGGREQLSRQRARQSGPDWDTDGQGLLRGMEGPGHV
jgi:hypothetical protein